MLRLLNLYILSIAGTLGVLQGMAQPSAQLTEDFLPKDYLTTAFHEGRRKALRDLMPDNSVMVIFAYPLRTFSNDVEYLYHPNPDLFYFSGYKEPNSLLLLFKSPQTDESGNSYNSLFFVQKRDALAERWTGRRLGTEGVKSKLDLQTVYNGEDFENFIIDFAKFDKIIMDELPEDVIDRKREKADLYELVQQFRTKAAVPANYKTDKRFDLKTYHQLTAQLREIKTDEELLLLRKAIEISCQGQNEVMKAVHPNMSELEIQGLHEFVHKKYGAENVGYGSIIGSGENGCILHYTENAKTKIGNSMLLMDVGAEYHGYTADVTRTIPVDGKFSAEEKAIYQLV
ncbi:MAG TPA: aminopeptidase P N-terminal domain-containing protein, partial [Chitinophagaceae bacterium]|nr:aminopeptidase P N-terminal domain-containing protein [Chitinophagaceae bacterium]